MKEAGYNFSAVSCDRKWRNLTVTFRRKDLTKKKTGGGMLPF